MFVVNSSEYNTNAFVFLTEMRPFSREEGTARRYSAT
jgi:hypothetical protein